MSVQELAAKTAAEIRRRGWTFGTMANYVGGRTADNCKVCLAGGIAAAAYGHPEALDKHGLSGEWVTPSDPDVVDLLDEIRLRTDTNEIKWSNLVAPVTAWNDRQLNEGPVLALLDEIASGS